MYIGCNEQQVQWFIQLGWYSDIGMCEVGEQDGGNVIK